MAGAESPLAFRGFRVLGCKVIGFRARSGIKVFRVQGLGPYTLKHFFGLRFRVQGLRIKVWGFREWGL